MRTLDPARGQQILDAAAQLFARRHYHEVRMDDIATQAGVAKGTLYRYFADKEDLYLALTLHGTQRLLEESQCRIARAARGEDKLRSFIAGVVCFYERYPYFLDLWARIETSRSAASIAALQTIRAQFLRLVADIMSDLHAEGQYHLEDPHLAALALMGINRGILRFLPQPWPDDLADWISNQFLHGVARCQHAAGRERLTPPGPGEAN
jgi:AcrR family transcriptional regulator